MPRYAYTFLVIMGLCLFSCTFDKPQTPSWDVDLNIPLTEQSINMGDVVSDFSHIFADKDGLLGISFNGEIDTTRIVDKLAVPAFAAEYQLSLPELYFPSLPLGVSTYEMKDIYPASVASLSDIVVPASAFNDLPCRSGDENYFKFLHVDRGTIRLSITNNFPIPFENLVFRFFDSSYPESEIISPTISRINAFSTQQVFIKIADKHFSFTGGWTISGATPGSNGQRISVAENYALSAETELVQFSVSALDSKIPSLEIQDIQQVELQQEYWVEELALKSGHLSLTYENSMQIGAEMNLTLDCFTHKVTREPLIVPLSFAARSSSHKQIDLKDYILSLVDDEQEVLNVIPISFSAITQDVDDAFVSLAQNDGFSFQFEMQDVEIEYITGRFPVQEFALPEFEQEIQLPNEFDNFNGLNLAEAVLQLDIYNRLHLPFQFVGSLSGYSSDGQKCEIPINQVIEPAVGLLEKENNLPMFTAENSNVADLINLPPQKVKIEGIVRVGSDNQNGSLRWDDYLRAAFDFRTPAYLSWEETTISADSEKVYITPLDYDMQTPGDAIVELSADQANHVRGFTLVALVENHLPVGGSIALRLATDEHLLYSHPEIEFSDIQVEPALTDADGAVQKANVQNIEIELSEKDAEVFHNETGALKEIFISSDFTLDGTNGKKVKFYNSDYLTFKAIAKLSFKVEKD